MTAQFADDYFGIPDALMNNAAIRQRMISLITSEPVVGKAIEGGDRLDRLRVILIEMTGGKLDLNSSIAQVGRELPRNSSIYLDDNRVFAIGWEERLIRTQFSRFYNQAVLEMVIAEGGVDCFIPHSSAEQSTTSCSINLAGRRHLAKPLLERLISSYRDGNFSNDLKVPHHPHCTHVVKP